MPPLSSASLQALRERSDEIANAGPRELAKDADELAAIASLLGRKDLSQELSAAISNLRTLDRKAAHARDALERAPNEPLERNRVKLQLEQVEVAENEHRSILRIAARKLSDAAASAPRDKWVISLHGIRTHGEWQKQLTEHLNSADLKAKAPNYGWFSAWRFLFASQRQKQIEKFREEYTNFILAHPGVLPSIVAHSFGSYIVATCLENYGMKFDRIILAGSIVREDFPWGTLLDRGRVTRVLNDVGHRDIWSHFAMLAVPDAGPSGWKGFSSDADGSVVQAFHRSFRHSDAFFTLNYIQRWIPFLLGQDPEPTINVPVPFNWPYWLVRAVVMMIVIFAIWLWRS
jgi:hypothetical protein